MRIWHNEWQTLWHLLLCGRRIANKIRNMQMNVFQAKRLSEETFGLKQFVASHAPLQQLIQLRYDSNLNAQSPSEEVVTGWVAAQRATLEHLLVQLNELSECDAAASYAFVVRRRVDSDRRRSGWPASTSALVEPGKRVPFLSALSSCAASRSVGICGLPLPLPLSLGLGVHVLRCAAFSEDN